MKKQQILPVAAICSFHFLVAFGGVKDYQDKLSQIAPSHLNQMKAPDWNSLTPLIDQEVLNDAASKAEAAAKLMFSPGIQSIPRPKKLTSRIEIKKLGQQPDIGYKVNSDFLAFRVPAAVSHIEATIKSIEKNVQANGGISFLRSAVRGDAGQLNDIIFYLFVYLPTIGYVTEIQIGHPFAMYTFALDSKIRDMRNKGEPTDEIVDLWAKQDAADDGQNCFYLKVKNQILKPNDNFDLEAELEKAFENKPVDPELLKAIRAFGEI